MNRAIWIKAVRESWLQLAVCSAILVLFAWVFVWLMSQLQVGAFGIMLRLMPGFMKQIVGVPVGQLATPTGQLSIPYAHPITLLICVGWALGRGSGVVSGEIARGTMDLVLVLPVRRATLIFASAVVSLVGAAVLAAAILAGTWLGVTTVDLPEQIDVAVYLPGAVNLMLMTFCLGGITTLVSSFGRDRWRTIVVAGGFFVASLVLEIVGRLWQGDHWVKTCVQFCTFLSAFQPQTLILEPEKTGPLALPYNATLLGIALLCYAAAAVVFSYRDIPAAK